MIFETDELRVALRAVQASLCLELPDYAADQVVARRLGQMLAESRLRKPRLTQARSKRA